MSMAEPDATALLCALSKQEPRRRDRGWTANRAAMLMLALSAAVTCLLAAAGYALVAGWFRAGGSTYVENVFPFWAWSRFLHETTVPSRIYDFPLLNAFQHRIGLGYQERMPFAYPPSYLLLLWPLGLLTAKMAYGAFLAVNLAAYVAATRQPGWSRLSAGLAAIAPSTVIALAMAQNSLLVAALLFGGCRLVGRRPIMAGVLFGLMSFKPQFGLLLPVALISAREWRCFSAATATVLASVIVSGAAFGWNTWTAMPAALAGLDHFVSPLGFAARSPTISASLRLLGAGPDTVRIGQILAAALTGATVFWCFRRGFRRLPTAALMVGVFFTTPYAFDYDLPIVTCAVLLICLDAKSTRAVLRAWEVIVLVFVVALPYLLFFTPVGPPYGGIGLVCLLGLIVRRVFLSDRRQMLAAAVRLDAVIG